MGRVIKYRLCALLAAALFCPGSAAAQSSPKNFFAGTGVRSHFEKPSHKAPETFEEVTPYEPPNNSRDEEETAKRLRLLGLKIGTTSERDAWSDGPHKWDRALNRYERRRVAADAKGNRIDFSSQGRERSGSTPSAESSGARGMVSQGYLQSLMEKVRGEAELPPEAKKERGREILRQPDRPQRREQEIAGRKLPAIPARYPRAKVSLFVSAQPAEHFHQQLRKVIALQAKGYAIGEVSVVSAKTDLGSLFLQTKELFSEAAVRKLSAALKGQPAPDELSLKPVSRDAAEALLITGSPTWIIEDRGAQHVFEGYESIDAFFSADGRFEGSIVGQSLQRGADGVERYYYAKKRGTVPFPEKVNSGPLGVLEPNEATSRKILKSMETTVAEKAAETIASSELPQCARSESYGTDVSGYSLGGRQFTLLYYDPRVESHSKLAAQWGGAAVAYGGRISPMQPGGAAADGRIFSVRALNVRCLPTRVDLKPNASGELMLMYHEGDDAFGQS